MLIATGSEVALALAAAEQLAARGPPRPRGLHALSLELFEAQPAAYREDGPAAAHPLRGWRSRRRHPRLERYVGLDGGVVGLDRFGASAPCQTLYREWGSRRRRWSRPSQGVL